MKIATVVLLVFVVTGMASASDSGLEVPPAAKVYVVVEVLTDNEKKLGLTKELIQSKVELQLHRNGIPLGSREESFKSGCSCSLYVNCQVMGSAFTCSIDFNREVFYRVGGDIHSFVASTYHRGGLGFHGTTSRYVIQSLIDLVDEFSNDFLKSNQTKTKSNKPDAVD